MSTTVHRATAFPASLALLLLSACVTRIPVPEHLRAGPPPAAVSAFAAPGPRAVSVERGQTTSASGCTVKYELHAPEDDGGGTDGAATARPLIVLAHGFMRNLGTMRGWAALWASHGHRTVVMSFCNSTWANGNHERNAEDMTAVARILTAEGSPVLYAGFSAGGLSALLAARNDPAAAAYLGLDPVDSGGLSAATDRLEIPALFLYGEPSRCNAENNMAGLMPEAAPAIALRVSFATHCDFENPYDPRCELLCGRVEPETEAEAIRETIRGLAGAWTAAWLEGDPIAEAVFSGAVLRTRAVPLAGPVRLYPKTARIRSQ